MRETVFGSHSHFYAFQRVREGPSTCSEQLCEAKPTPSSSTSCTCLAPYVFCIGLGLQLGFNYGQMPEAASLPSASACLHCCLAAPGMIGYLVIARLELIEATRSVHIHTAGSNGDVMSIVRRIVLSCVASSAPCLASRSGPYYSFAYRLCRLG